MAVAPPNRAELSSLNERLRTGIAESDLDVYHDAASGIFDSWQAVDELYAAQTDSAPTERSWVRPQDNPLGAWAAQTELQTTPTGPLAGRTVAIKDNVAVAGVPMLNGSQMLRGFVPDADATVVSRLLDAGAIIKGKSTCEDLCFSGGSHTSKPAPVRNPWDPTRMVGGSSSGNAALIAAGEVDLGLGGDQGGSIRIPAAFSGIVGHKPSFGLVPYTGAFPIEQTIDHLGPMARTVADVADMLQVLAGYDDGADPRQPTNVRAEDYLAEQQRALRIGVVREGFELENADPLVNAVVRHAVDRLTGVGHEADEISIPWHRRGPALWDVVSVEGATWQMINGNGFGLNWQGRYDPNLMAHYAKTWRADPSRFSETVKLVLLSGTHALATGYGSAYAKARHLAGTLTAAYDEQLDTYDVLVMPTLPITARTLPAPDAGPGEVITKALEMVGNTAPFNLTGHPACSVPAGLAQGLPVGLMIIGKKFADAQVLSAARAVEAVLGTLPLPQPAPA